MQSIDRLPLLAAALATGLAHLAALWLPLALAIAVTVGGTGGVVAGLAGAEAAAGAGAVGLICRGRRIGRHLGHDRRVRGGIRG